MVKGQQIVKRAHLKTSLRSPRPPPFLEEIYQTMTYWLLQGNPKYYRITEGEGIRDFEQMPWLAMRYAKDMAPSDGVLGKEIWG